jgi:hypothetical protein
MSTTSNLGRLQLDRAVRFCVNERPLALAFFAQGMPTLVERRHA